MPRIHPTACVDRDATLADDVEVGPYAVVEGRVGIGPGCVLREHAVIRRFTTLGRENVVDSFAVLGGLPQDLKFDPATESYLRIGNGNVFREGVTISRATAAGGATIVGSRTYWMTCAHAGHDAVVEDECILVNGAALAGHSRVGRRAIISAHVGVHQFCRVGEGVMAQGNAAISMHVPPFTIVSQVGRVVSLNVVGLRRWPGLTQRDRAEVKQAFSLVYRESLPLREALARMDGRTDWGSAAASFREFVRDVVTAAPPHDRGLCPLRRRARGEG